MRPAPSPPAGDLVATVLFCDGELQPGDPWTWKLFARFLAPGFGHVRTIVFDPEGDAFAVVDSASRGVRVRAVAAGPDGAATARRLMAEYPHTARAVVALPRDSCDGPARGLPGCVGLAKRVLGVRHWSLTPRQLYRRLTGPLADVLQAEARRGSGQGA